MKFLRFAAIDIGSNSVRMLIENVIEDERETFFKKGTLVRVPVRLGDVVFKEGLIPEAIEKLLESAMLGYLHLMEANQVEYYKACATSAMREAKNGKEVVERIYKKTGVKIDIIGGEIEAEIIYNGQKFTSEKLSKNCVFVDVGGGSTEITILSDSKKIAAESFPIGTIRLLNNQVEKETWLNLKTWLKSNLKALGNYTLIGSGGNINRLSKLAQLKKDKPLSYDKLKNIVEEIRVMPLEQRIKDLDLNPDRADVIVPAGDIFINIMKWIESDDIYIPKIGLSDGIVREAYKEWKLRNSLPVYTNII